jgi:hypothetical protein
MTYAVKAKSLIDNHEDDCFDQATALAEKLEAIQAWVGAPIYEACMICEPDLDGEGPSFEFSDGSKLAWINSAWRVS